MPEETMTLDRLTPNEVAVIKAIRQWRKFPETIPCAILTAETADQIAGFVSYLWRTDPYAVNVGSVLDKDLRLFEVQLLYVISEQMAGNNLTTSEILAWWFANDEQGCARASLNSICVQMQLAGVAVSAASWIRGHLQAMTLRRVRSGARDVHKRAYSGVAEPRSVAIH